jgi:hypothetical protein
MLAKSSLQVVRHPRINNHSVAQQQIYIPHKSFYLALFEKQQKYYHIFMKPETESKNCCQGKMMLKKHHYHCGHGQSGAIYGLGVVGALFYFLQSATSLGMVLVGIGKSIFWPAILMFKLLTYLQM